MSTQTSNFEQDKINNIAKQKEFLGKFESSNMLLKVRLHENIEVDGKWILKVINEEGVEQEINYDNEFITIYTLAEYVELYRCYYQFLYDGKIFVTSNGFHEFDYSLVD